MNYIQKALHRQTFLFAALLGDEDQKNDLQNAVDATDNQKEAREANALHDDNKSGHHSVNVKQYNLTDMGLQNQMLLREKSIRKAKNAFRMSQNDMGQLRSSREGILPENLARTANEQVHLEQCAQASRKTGADNQSVKSNLESLIDPHCKANILFTKSADSTGAQTTDWVQSARDLSRLYQRDARRYDGGYPLY